MLSYTDYVLAQRPTVYCRLNEPLGYDRYADISGNGFDMYWESTVDDEKVLDVSATNQQTFALPGEPDSAGVLIADGHWQYWYWDDPINDRAPRPTPQAWWMDELRVRYEKLGEDYGELKPIKTFWGTVIMGATSHWTPRFKLPGSGSDAGEGGYEPMVALGPFRITVETIHSTLNTYNGYKIRVDFRMSRAFDPVGGNYSLADDHENVWTETVVQTSPPIADRYSGDDWVHFVVGAKIIDAQNCEFWVYENGVEVHHSTHTVPWYDSFLVASVRSDVYRLVNLQGVNKFSCVAYGLHAGVPSAQWAADAYAALTTSYTPAAGYDTAVAFNNRGVQGAKEVSPNQGSFLAMLDKNLTIGNNHGMIESISVNGLEVTATLILPYTPHRRGIIKFDPGDQITIDGSPQANLNGMWTIKSKANKQIVFDTTLACSNETFTDTVIIKLTPIGGGHWERVTSANNCYFKSNHANFIDRVLYVDDSQEDETGYRYSRIWMAREAGMDQSQDLYLLRSMQLNSGQIDLDFERSDWNIIGDGERFYFFLTPRLPSVSTSQIYFFGRIKDFDDDTWYTNLMAKSFYDGHYSGTNYAMLYPYWEILDTGHLRCSRPGDSYGTHPTFQDRRRWIRIDDTLTAYEIMSTIVLDSGRHLYPIPR